MAALELGIFLTHLGGTLPAVINLVHPPYMTASDMMVKSMSPQREQRDVLILRANGHADYMTKFRQSPIYLTHSKPGGHLGE